MHPYGRKLGHINCEFMGETLNDMPSGYGSLNYAHNNDISEYHSFKGFAKIEDSKIKGDAFLIGGVPFVRVNHLENGVRNGFGRLYEVDQLMSYEGNFLNSMRHGKGTYISELGLRFDGEFDRDCMKEGVMTLKNGTKFKQIYNVDSDLDAGNGHWNQKPVSME